MGAFTFLNAGKSGDGRGWVDGSMQVEGDLEWAIYRRGDWK